MFHLSGKAFQLYLDSSNVPSALRAPTRRWYSRKGGRTLNQARSLIAEDEPCDAEHSSRFLSCLLPPFA